MSDLEIEILIITFQSVRRIRKCMYMSSLFGKGKVGGGGGGYLQFWLEYAF